MEGKSTEQSHIGNFSFRRNPPLHDLLTIELSDLSLTAFARYLRHTDYLKTLVCCYDAEICGFLMGAFAGVLHFQFSAAVRAFATCESIAKVAFLTLPNVSAVGAGHCSAIGTIGEMLKAVAICPFLLCRGYGAQCG